MAVDLQVQELLEEISASGRTPEEVMVRDRRGAGRHPAGPPQAVIARRQAGVPGAWPGRGVG